MISIAVVIPCFNLGRTLEQAVQSVFWQTREVDQLVVVDDGSTDPYTRELLERASWPRTELIRAEHRGVAAARNLGASRTHPSSLLFLDADDLLQPNALQAMAGRLDASPEVDFVASGLQELGADTTWTPLPADLERGALPISCLIRRTLWDRLGGFDERFPFEEDTDFWLTALSRGARCEIISEPLLAFRVRHLSRSHRSLGQDSFREVQARLREKHQQAILASPADALLTRERLLQQQQDYHRSLTSRLLAAEQRSEALTRETAAVRAELAKRQQPLVDFGELRHLTPRSPYWGRERGLPVDRYYIERFLDSHRADVRGRVLEVKDLGYTRRYGMERVDEADVLDIDPANPQATLIADLASPEHIPEDRYDCFIFTQTLHIIYDARAALVQAHRLLKPGGVLLCTVPCVSRLNYEDGGLDGGDFWRFTEASLRKLFDEVFAGGEVQLVSGGNVLTSTAFLQGLAVEELSSEELEHCDPHFPLQYCIRAVKAGGARSARTDRASASGSIFRFPQRLSAADRHRALALLATRCALLSLPELLRGAREATLPLNAVAVTLEPQTPKELEEITDTLQALGLRATVYLDGDFLHPAGSESQLLKLAALPKVTLGVRPTCLELSPVSSAHLQLLRCKTYLEEVLDRSVVHLAFPEGGLDAHRAELVRQSGFQTALTGIEGTIGAGTDPLLLPGYPVPVEALDFESWLSERLIPAR